MSGENVLVFNLTDNDLTFRNRVIPKNGGSLNYAELDVFMSNRDRKLVERRVIALGGLPKWWKVQRAALASMNTKVALTELPSELPTEPLETVTIQDSVIVKKKRKRSEKESEEKE